MKLLVLGASGLVGWNLWQEIQARGLSGAGTYFRSPIDGFLPCDMTKKEELAEVVHSVDPDVIFSTAALSGVDYCELHPDENRKYNVEAYENLLELIHGTPIKLVFYSTDYVFDGESGPYEENHPVNPINNYGRAKAEIETRIQETLVNYLILRTTVVYGLEHQGKNFILRLIKRNRAGEIIHVPVDQIGTPTFARDLARASLFLTLNESRGIFHVAGPDLLSRYEFSLIACEIFDLNPDLVVPQASNQLDQPARRPLKLGLLIDKLDATVGKKIMSSVKRGLKELKNSLPAI